MSRIEHVTLQEFELRIASYADGPPRKITGVHIHHTWRPRRRDWRGLPTVQAMRNYHMGQGMRDIAQHLTIDPDGGLWLGRDIAWPPGSAKGSNGSSTAGPFMIEIVGDFDAGQDALAGAQLDAVVSCVAALADRFKLPRVGADNVRAWLHAHTEFALKSCPGDAVYTDSAHWVGLDGGDSLDRRVVKQPPAAALAGSAIAARSASARATRASVDRSVEDVSVPEFDEEMGAWLAREANLLSLASRGLESRTANARTDDTGLRRHAVNSRLGELSSSGYATTTEHLDCLFNVHVRSWLAERRNLPGAERPPCILLWAHGGLVAEQAALQRVSEQSEFWKRNGIYPIYFVWETGFFETLGQIFERGRGVTDVSDYVQERLARIGKPLWSAMRKSAWRNSQARLDNGAVGAAVLVKRHLDDLLRDLGRQQYPRPEIHVIGHSAGSIFLCEMFNAGLLNAGQLEAGQLKAGPLNGKGTVVASVQFLAPALRMDKFRDELLPHLKPSRFALYTMSDERERDDHCGPTYRKSLLYLVRQALETKRRTPLLGLERDILDVATLCKAFGIVPPLSGRPPASEHKEGGLHVFWSRDPDGSAYTKATSHGGFDDDPSTLDSLVRFIHGRSDTGAIDVPYLDYLQQNGRAVDRSDFTWPDPALADTAPTAVPPIAMPLRSSPPAAGSSGQRLAVCVGIDRYPDKPLQGAVADARDWEKYFTATQGFSVMRRLHDEEATLSGIVTTLGELVERGRRGDLLTFFYSGHGVQCADIRSPNANQDEPDEFDEALVPIDADRSGYLLDDLIAATLRPLADGCKLVMIMDCCHSGTNMRFAPSDGAQGDERTRYVPPSAAGLAATRAWVRQSGLPPADTRSIPGILHFAACRDDEYAYESNGRGHFSLHALAELRAGGGEFTPARLISEVRRRFGAARRQTPLFHTGPWRDQAVFSIDAQGTRGAVSGLASLHLPFLGR